MTPEANRKDPRWKSIVANARAIHGALGECLKLSDQLSDSALKRETMTFVNRMEFLVATLMGQRTRVSPTRPSEKDLIKKLREETLHIRQLLGASNQTARDLGDGEAERILFTTVNKLNQFEMMIDRHNR